MTGISNGLRLPIYSLMTLVLSSICTVADAQSRDGSFSPDGSLIVYSSTINGISEIFIMNSDGSNNRQITKLGYNSFYPFFSPDGNTILFMSYPKSKATVCVIGSDGSNFRRLTDENEENGDPHWSPDGKQVIFYSERDGNNEIYSMAADGSSPRRLTNDPASDQTPSVSPDNKHIVFVSDRDGNAELFIMDIDGRNTRQLTFDPRSDRVPCWSPDGKKIIWYSRELPEVAGSGADSWNGAEIYEIHADGSNRRQLTHNQFMDHGPVYSPDGRNILFTSARTGQREIFMMKNDGSEVRQLTFP